MAGGYIKLFRSMTRWEWYQDANTCRVFLHLLLLANHEDIKWQGISVMPGQLVTSVGSISTSLKLSSKSVRVALNHLKTTNEVAIKTTNRFTLVTLANWASYQSDIPKGANETANETASEGQTEGKQRATNKKDKNDKKVRNIDSAVSLDLSFILDEPVRASFAEYVEYRKSKGKAMIQMTAEKAYKGLVNLTKIPQGQIDIIDNAIAKGWQGLYPIKSASSPQSTGKTSNIGNFEGRNYTKEDYAGMYEEPPIV